LVCNAHQKEPKGENLESGGNLHEKRQHIKLNYE
jgi:hypothetical protein